MTVHLSGLQLTQRTLRHLAVVAMTVAWLVPNHYPPWYSYYNDSCMAVALLLLILGCPIQLYSNGIPVAACCLIGVATIPWLQWAFGLLAFTGDAWILCLYILGFATAIWAGHVSASKNDNHLAVLLAVSALVGASISSAIGMLQALDREALGISMHYSAPGMRAEGNLAQPNNLATLIGFGALGLMFLWEKRFLGVTSAGCLLLLLIVGASLTQSRTALLFGPVICFCLYLYSKRHHHQLKTKTLTVAIATALHWSIAWVWPSIEKSLLLSPPTSLASRGLTDVRLQAWTMFIGAINEAPWIGYGWLQSANAQFYVAERFPALNQIFYQTHNLFLELLVWSGYPLGLLLCSSIVYWFVTRLKRISTVESLCGFLVVVVLGVHSMLELPYHYAYFLIPAGLWIGLVEYSIGSRSRLSVRSSLALPVLTFSLLIAIWRDYSLVEEDFRLARFELLNIGSINADKSVPNAPFLSTLAAQLRFYRTPPQAGMSEFDLARMDALVKRYPFSDSIYSYALALALNGRRDEAQRMFLKIRYIQGEGIYRSFRHALQLQSTGTNQSDLLLLFQSLPR